MKRALILSALGAALFGTKWDLAVCEQRLASLRACAPGDLMRGVHLISAIDAIKGARDSFAAAKEFARKLKKAAR